MKGQYVVHNTQHCSPVCMCRNRSGSICVCVSYPAHSSGCPGACAHPRFPQNVPCPQGAPRQNWESSESVPSRCLSFAWLHWECAVQCLPGPRVLKLFVQGSESQHFRHWWIRGFATRAGCFWGHRAQRSVMAENKRISFRLTLF